MIARTMAAGWLVLAALTAAAAGESHQDHSPVGRTIDDFTLRDHLGTSHSLADWQDRAAIVVVFLGTECPVAKHYASRLQELADRYADRGVQVVGINSNRQDSLAEIEHYARLHGVEFPILKDPGNRVADQFAAIRTPEAFVLDGDSVVRYWGRIDNQFGVGYARDERTVDFVAEALEEVLAGEPVTTESVESVGCYIGRVQRDAPRGEVTYTRHVAPLLNQHCVRCHRAGEVAPFALTSYDEVAGWGETIAEVIRDQRMPPWHADPDHGEFSNDARMPDEEKQLIYRWVDGGMPAGDPADLPAPPEFVEGWQIDTPDAVYRMEEEFAVPARGIVPYQHVYLEATFDRDTWVQQAEARPGNRAVVHHLILFYVPPGQQRHRDIDALRNAIATFAPGMPALDLPEGYAMRIPAGARLVFQAHYTPNGSPQTDRSEIGLVFADPETVEHEVHNLSALNWKFLIPSGDPDYRVEADQQIGQDMLLYALTPHMHYRGKSFRFTAHYPDGGEEILLDVPRYDFNWQNSYILQQPKPLPAGTEVEMVAHYDNSADNLLNPDPSQAVHWGEQTWDEMMIGTLTVSPARQNLTLGPPRVEPIEGQPERRRVTFRHRPDQAVEQVHLAGSFNDWQPTGHAMDGPDAEGWFTTSLELAPGQYEYKFVLDGTEWRTDPGNREQAGFYHNSLLHVK